MSGPLAGPALYPIRAVSRLTGIGIDTLRAWERRYRAVEPVRDRRGRMYSDEDVARLRLLNQGVQRLRCVLRRAVAPPGRVELRWRSKIGISACLLGTEGATASHLVSGAAGLSRSASS